MKPSDTQAPPYIVQALALYQLPVAQILPPQKGYRNQSFPVRLHTNEMVNFILYKNEPGIAEVIQRTNAVADFAFAAGLPARHTRDARILRIHSQHETRYGALYNYLPGQTISWEAYTKMHIKVLGASLSNLHAVLAEFPDVASLPSVAQNYHQILGRMIRYFTNPSAQKAMRDKLHLQVDIDTLKTFQAFVQACNYMPDQQALHMDFVRSNVLFSEDATSAPRITGILDFEKTACGHCSFDIARTLAFLLVDCKYKTPAQVQKYFLDSGYNKRGASTIHQTFVRVNGTKMDLLQALVNMFLAYDFYKFLRHNPYEFLYQNEHFVRTRDLLATHTIIKL